MNRLEFITVNFVSPTDTKGAKFKAEYKTGNLKFKTKISFDYSRNAYQNAYNAVTALLLQYHDINLMHSDCIGYTLENDTYTFIFK